MPIELMTFQITLMDWGNAIVKSKTIDPSSGKVTSIEVDLHLEGDFKKTKKKITWIALPTTSHPLIPITLLDYDYLITKKKLEEDDNVLDFTTPVSEFRESALTDGNIHDLKKGDYLQFERKGYFVFDGKGEDGKLEFIRIPDGKAAGLASKATPAAPVKTTEPKTTMYKVESIYAGGVKPELDSKMYKLDSIYDH